MTGYENAVKLLPARLALAVEKSALGKDLWEIRLRTNGPFSLTVRGENVCLDAHGRRCDPGCGLDCTREDLQLVLERATDGSLYRYMPALQKGYVTTATGIRVGVCGSGVYGSQNGVTSPEVTSLNLRIPRFDVGGARQALQYYRRHGLASTLFYAPPAGGKTTLIRDLALRLSSGEAGRPYRVAVADEREEIFPAFWQTKGLLDVLRGYGKEEAMECALRVLNPQVLVCDELGSGECGMLRRLMGSGIVFMATAHASCAEDLKRRGELGELIREGYFPLLAGISLKEGGLSLCFHPCGGAEQ